MNFPSTTSWKPLNIPSQTLLPPNTRTINFTLINNYFNYRSYSSNGHLSVSPVTGSSIIYSSNNKLFLNNHPFITLSLFLSLRRRKKTIKSHTASNPRSTEGPRSTWLLRFNIPSSNCIHESTSRNGTHEHGTATRRKRGKRTRILGWERERKVGRVFERSSTFIGTRKGEGEGEARRSEAEWKARRRLSRGDINEAWCNYFYERHGI